MSRDELEELFQIGRVDLGGPSAPAVVVFASALQYLFERVKDLHGMNTILVLPFECEIHGISVDENVSDVALAAATLAYGSAIEVDMLESRGKASLSLEVYRPGDGDEEEPPINALRIAMTRPLRLSEVLPLQGKLVSLAHASPHVVPHRPSPYGPASVFRVSYEIRGEKATARYTFRGCTIEVGGSWTIAADHIALVDTSIGGRNPIIHGGYTVAAGFIPHRIKHIKINC